ncbi:MAG: cholest-4-en-3-one 26-monooxygenase, partial [Nocardioidaceae bacterium]|nr:cholest-4-en-3-one 26-monooxygenase [Nocardioidaceae bacterium]
MTTTSDASTIPAGFDPTDPGINEAGIPHDEFLEMRLTAPVFWVEQTPEARAGMLGDSGYWAISKHADVSAISKSKDFVTSENGAIIRFAPDMTRDQVEMQGVMLINQDPPVHTATRSIISRGFTPRSIEALREGLTEHAVEIVREAIERGEGDFVEEVAAELPLVAIANLLGVPLEDRKKLFEWSNQMLAYDDPDYEGDPETASIEILSYFMALAEQRKAEPKDDIVTKLVTAGEDGEGMASDEFGYFTIILAVAGNETTRNAITHGMNAFFNNP